jgi:CubicO group peptidase (beta-lactamase class C family)
MERVVILCDRTRARVLSGCTRGMDGCPARGAFRPVAARLITEGSQSRAASEILLAVRRGLTGIAFLLCLASASAGIGPDERASAALEKYVQQALRDWEVPGAAIAVVKDDRIVYSAGFGTRTLGKDMPVDEWTLFAIGSITKSFTAAAIAILADEGKLSIDDPASKYLPGLEFSEPHLTREVTVRDLLSHRSGLPRASLLLMNRVSPEDTVARLRFMKPAAGLRAQFHYSNQGYVALGEIIEKLSDDDWASFIEDRLFAPLGMNASTTSFDELHDAENAATPHAKIKGQLCPIPLRDLDNTAPAGAIGSNAIELAEWVKLQLAGGTKTGREMLKASAVREMHSPQTIIPVSPAAEKLYRSTHFIAYGMGWFMRDYRGRKIIEHGGNVDGMTAQVGMLPEERLGFVMLTNMDSTRLPTALMYRVFDIWTGAPERDWSGDFLRLARDAAREEDEATKAAVAARKTDTTPSAPLRAFAGVYRSELYGEAHVSVDDDELTLSFGDDIEAVLQHWENDTFKAVWTDPVIKAPLITFSVKDGQRVEKFAIPDVGEFMR